MKPTNYKEFIYLNNNDYDKEIKINEEALKLYSKKYLKEKLSGNEIKLVGETFESKKRNKDKDIGRIELNEKRLNVGEKNSHCKLFRNVKGYVEVTAGGYISILGLRIVPIILICAILLSGIGFGAFSLITKKIKIDPNEKDPYVQPVYSEGQTVSGTVYFAGEKANNAELTIKVENSVVSKTTTDKDGNYLFAKIPNGIYTITAKFKDSTISKALLIDNMPVEKNFKLTASNLTVNVDSSDEKTPPVAVNGLDEISEVQVIDGKHVDVTLVAKHLEQNDTPSSDVEKIQEKSGETKLTFFDFSIYKEIFTLSGVSESRDGITEVDKAIEIIVPYKSYTDVGTYVFRSHGGQGFKFTELSSRPTGDYQDGTCYVSAEYVFVYTKYFSTYAIGSASSDKVVKGSDVLVYSNKAYINLTTKKIEMMYEHDENSSNSARIEIYLVDNNGNNLKISTSGIIPPGNKLETMILLDNISNMPSVGTYEGLMKIYYLNDNGTISTNVEIPLNVAITK